MAELLSEDELAEQLPDGWEREGEEIVRTFAFDGYMRGLAFAQMAGEIAQTQDAYPRMVVDEGAVEVRFTADEEGGITATDVETAQFVDSEYDG